MLNKEEKAFLKQLLKKTIIMFGFTYFSVAVTLQTFTTITPSLLASALYLFTELIKYYKIQPDKKLLTSSNKKHYDFII